MKTMLIVMIIGVTLFLDTVDINRHKQDMVVMTKLDAKKAIVNL
tara:strand:+ start:296 stop:427 length:132 start_codon:yes stop_codon:yes gene_type:complete